MVDAAWIARQAAARQERERAERWRKLRRDMVLGPMVSFGIVALMIAIG